MPFVEAVRHLCECTKHWPFPKTTPQPKEPKPFVLPKCHSDNNRVIQYLMQRGLSEETIQMCINKGILYEDYHHNCCFVGKDENGMPRYATIRSSSPYHTFLMDVKGSDKAYSFQIGTPTSKKLFLFESAIDLLSYYELSANKQNSYLSVSGVYQPKKKDTAYTIPAAVTKFLTQNPHIKTIHIWIKSLICTTTLSSTPCRLWMASSSTALRGIICRCRNYRMRYVESTVYPS